MAEFKLSELRAWREKHGISQAKLATIAGLGINTILNIENGQNAQQKTYDKIVEAIAQVTANPVVSAGKPRGRKVGGPKSTVPGQAHREAPVPAPKKPGPKTLKQAPALEAEKAQAGKTPTPEMELKGNAKKPRVSRMGTAGAPGEFRAWREANGLSHPKLMQVSNLSLETIRKLDAGKPVQARILEKVEQLRAQYTKTASLKPASEVKVEPAATVRAEASPVPAPVTVALPVPAANVYPPLSNLDLEIINQVMKMTPYEKIKLLEHILK